MGTRYQGTCASDGLYIGPVRRLSGQSYSRQSSGDPIMEREALVEAIRLAADDLTRMMETVDGDSQDILAFQLAMLEDDALTVAAFESIAAGVPADAAWPSAIDAEIAGYETAEDEYFRARAADLRDMRDRVLRRLANAEDAVPGDGAVLVGDDIAPTVFLENDWSRGGAIALFRGSTTSHVAMLARARGIPMVVGLGACELADGQVAAVDGGAGLVVADPTEAEASQFRMALVSQASRRAAEDRFRQLPAHQKNGKRIDVLINVAAAEELDQLNPADCDGIGLMRSEFLFRDGAPLPGEEAQYLAYRRLVQWAGGKPVTIRTLDIGGDKPVRGLTPEGEANPFLGLRGVRLTLAREDVFRTQLRALARACVHGNLKVMLPMVTVPDELSRSAALLTDCMRELEEKNVPCKRPPLGIMVEVPAVAVAPDLFREAAFFSIGSNDLTQYVTAASRDDARVAALNDPGHPAVLRLIAEVVRFGEAAQIPVSLCGDMASEPRYLAALLAAGLTSLSIAPVRLARVKAAIAEL